VFNTIHNHFNNFVDQFNDYVDQLPAKIPLAAVKSAIYSFACTAILSGNVRIGFFCAKLAATVAVINGLTMPFFRKAFSDNYGNIKWYHQAANQIVSLAMVQLFINSLTSYRVNLVVVGMFTVSLNLLLNGFANQSTYKSNSFIII
jgi:hypothetical protein